MIKHLSQNFTRYIYTTEKQANNYTSCGILLQYLGKQIIFLLNFTLLKRTLQVLAFDIYIVYPIIKILLCCLCNWSFVNIQFHYLKLWNYSPEMLYRTRSVGASFPYWLIMPFWAALGTGMVSTMFLWNLRRLGSTVTMGLTATRFPRSLETMSGEIGCACYPIRKEHLFKSCNRW